MMSKMLDFEGKVVLVTGGGSGMGTAIAKKFARAKADVVFTYNKHKEDAPLVKSMLEQYGGRIEGIKLDQQDVNECKSVVQKAFDMMGRLDVLINNSGLHGATLPMDIDQTIWDTMLETNLRGMFFCSQEAGRIMREQGNGGSIVSISSINSVNPLDQSLHYGCSKAGIEMVTRCLAKELGPDNIRVNAVAPGLIDNANLENFCPGWRDRFIDRAPLRRPVQKEEIADICVFLASSMANCVTGQTLIADCGVTLAAAY